MTGMCEAAATGERRRMAVRGGRMGGRMGGIAVHPSGGSRPRQHWVFASPPSPTTRPPRMNLVGWVRVVGLGVLSVGVLAGAGFYLECAKALTVICWWGQGGGLR